MHLWGGPLKTFLVGESLSKAKKKMCKILLFYFWWAKIGFVFEGFELTGFVFKGFAFEGFVFEGF